MFAMLFSGFDKMYVLRACRKCECVQLFMRCLHCKPRFWGLEMHHRTCLHAQPIHSDGIWTRCDEVGDDIMKKGAISVTQCCQATSHLLMQRGGGIALDDIRPLRASANIDHFMCLLPAPLHYRVLGMMCCRAVVYAGCTQSA